MERQIISKDVLKSIKHYCLYLTLFVLFIGSFFVSIKVNNGVFFKSNSFYYITDLLVNASESLQSLRGQSGIYVEYYVRDWLLEILKASCVLAVMATSVTYFIVCTIKIFKAKEKNEELSLSKYVIPAVIINFALLAVLKILYGCTKPGGSSIVVELGMPTKCVVVMVGILLFILGNIYLIENKEKILSKKENLLSLTVIFVVILFLSTLNLSVAMVKTSGTVSCNALNCMFFIMAIYGTVSEKATIMKLGNALPLSVIIAVIYVAIFTLLIIYLIRQIKDFTENNPKSEFLFVISAIISALSIIYLIFSCVLCKSVIVTRIGFSPIFSLIFSLILLGYEIYRYFDLGKILINKINQMNNMDNSNKTEE